MHKQQIIYLLRIINRNDLIYPAYEGWHFDIDTGHILAATPEAPADETCEFVVASILTYKGSTSISLQNKKNVIMFNILYLNV